MKALLAQYCGPLMDLYLYPLSWDNTIATWDVDSGRRTNILEGHTDNVISISFSSDARLLASKSLDNTVRLWRTDNWTPVAKLYEPKPGSEISNLAFHPSAPVLATLGEEGRAVLVWDLDYEEILAGGQATESLRYTTAKIVLLGESGVGKTGLGWRLARGEYKEHSSTHGQQFWIIDELGKKLDKDTECEAVLWDLAGQPDYRLVHTLFLDDVDLSLVLFDPTDRQDPLNNANFWLKQLKKGGQYICPTILIAARSDRGTATLTEAELNAYCQQQNISGGFITTSALTGEGLSEVLARIKEQIRWKELTATVTTTTFKRIKEYVLSLKERTGQHGVIVTPPELRQSLEALDPEWSFTDDEMMTAVRHLETHGYVTILKRAQGDTAILLAPDLLANLASSLVLEARRNPRGLGVLEEERLLRGEYKFPELTNLSKQEQEILLDSTAVLFLEHNICFRETFNEITFLVFPSLINEKRPVVEDSKTFEDASYRVSGAVENVYSSLVVLLGYTNTFTRTNQWQN
jgi:small GTP-binding protein